MNLLNRRLFICLHMIERLLNPFFRDGLRQYGFHSRRAGGFFCLFSDTDGCKSCLLYTSFSEKGTYKRIQFLPII